MAFMEACGASLLAAGAMGASSVQRRVFVERFPDIIVIPSRVTVAVVAVKMAAHRWSHSCPMEMSDPDAR
jgi:hypothetical protein